MSADAKIWQEDNQEWSGICDAFPDKKYAVDEYGLSELIATVEHEMGKSGMRWLMHVYPDGKTGLRGFTY